MPNCVVKGCKNQSTKNKKQDGITFHTFPNKAIKEKWIEVIRANRSQPSWNPTVRSVVCSTHFDDDDFYYTNKGLRRIVRNRYPKHVPAGPIESIDVDPIQPCSLRAHVPVTPIESVDVNPLEPCSSRTDVPVTPIESIDVDMKQPYSLRGHVSPTPVLSSTPGPNIGKENEAIFDTPWKHKLRLRNFRLENKQKQMKKKIKVLHQKVRRLEKRNKSLKEKLQNLRKRKLYISNLTDNESSQREPRSTQ